MNMISTLSFLTAAFWLIVFTNIYAEEPNSNQGVERRLPREITSELGNLIRSRLTFLEIYLTEKNGEWPPDWSTVDQHFGTAAWPSGQDHVRDYFQRTFVLIPPTTGIMVNAQEARYEATMIALMEAPFDRSISSEVKELGRWTFFQLNSQNSKTGMPAIGMFWSREQDLKRFSEWTKVSQYIDAHIKRWAAIPKVGKIDYLKILDIERRQAGVDANSRLTQTPPKLIDSASKGLEARPIMLSDEHQTLMSWPVWGILIVAIIGFLLFARKKGGDGVRLQLADKMGEDRKGSRGDH